MPKKIISAPRQRGKDFKRYICHPSVVKVMLNNLEKMPYQTPQDRLNFKIQLFKILDMFLKWWDSQGEDGVLYVLYGLFNYLNGDGCFVSNSEYKIYDYTTTPRLFVNYYLKTNAQKNLNDCNKRFVIFHVRLSSDVSDHTNLILFDKKNSISWRIEPNNGPKWDSYATIINPLFAEISKSVAPNFKFKGNYSGTCPGWMSMFYKNPNDINLPGFILKHIPLEQSSNYLPHAGLCMFISVGRLVYGNDLSDKILVDYIVKFIYSEYHKLCK